MTDDPSSRRGGMGSVYVESGSDTRLYVVLIPPDTAEIGGDYHAALKITSLGSGEEKILNFTASLSGSYGIALSPGKYSLKIEAGKSAELHVRVYNTGTSPLTNVKLNVELPEDWKTKAQITPERMSELGRDEVAEFTVKFTVPANVDSGGDYVVKISAVSDQDKSEEKIRVTVTKGGGSEYIGIAVILGALVLLGILLRKYGRR
ncbi:NEW3 domain-containing protein [Thermococcus sp. JCM 11816]|uniref:COG1470 family protein n=1 Tax=Thermococcus sp. (strain JCM 11816 / KS-1) TaxID=1295125 RepID=UPI0006D108C3